MSKSLMRLSDMARYLEVPPDVLIRAICNRGTLERKCRSPRQSMKSCRFPAGAGHRRKSGSFVISCSASGISIEKQAEPISLYRPCCIRLRRPQDEKPDGLPRGWQPISRL